MKQYLILGLLCSLALPGGVLAKDPVKPAAPTQPNANAQVTTFQCIPFNGNYATIARRGDRTTPPMIEWTTTLGSDWTPARRCQEVSQRLTRAVQLTGGKLRNLQLTYGSVNGNRVICYVDSGSSINACNSRNLLFTLRREDLNREKAILETLVKFSITGSGNHVQQSGEQHYALLGEAIEDALRGPTVSEGGTNPGI